mmetsp:Transcript_5174/g.12854  ORF Transcript_5174/g.12854 Transcript_5174/m.12854 type:complete len:516 (-) Transcript_5174:80-1627(-)
MTTSHRRAGAATALVLLVAAAMLVYQPTQIEAPRGPGVLERFLGSHKEQVRVAHSTEELDRVSEPEGEARRDEDGESGQAGHDGHGNEDEKQNSATNSTTAEDVAAAKLYRHYVHVFDTIEKEESLPPWIAVPPLVLLKLAFTFLVFGFDMRFIKKDDSQDCCWRAFEVVKDFFVWVVRFVFQIVSCALVLNTYRADWMEYRNAVKMLDAGKPGEGISFLEHFCLLAEVGGASGNFASAIIVFAATLEQRRSFGKPRYWNWGFLPYVGERLQAFPLVPGSAIWLGPVKHIYMYLLLPWVVVTFWLAGPLLMLLCGANVLVISKVCCGCVLCLFLGAATFGFVPSFWDSEAEFSAKLMPFLTFVGLLSWAAVQFVLILFIWPAMKCTKLSPSLFPYLQRRDVQLFVAHSFIDLQDDATRDFVPDTTEAQVQTDDVAPKVHEKGDDGEANDMTSLVEAESSDDAEANHKVPQALRDAMPFAPAIGEAVVLTSIGFRSLGIVCVGQVCNGLVCSRTSR